MKNDEIYGLLSERDKRFDAQMETLNTTIRYGLKGVRQYVDAGFETIHKAEEVRNNRIGKLEETQKCIKKETWLFRLVQRNPIPAAIVLLVLLVGGAWAYDHINVGEFIKHKFGIEMRDGK